MDDQDQVLRDKLLGYAKALGADGADCVAIRSASLDAAIRKGATEDAGRAESFGIGLRIFKGARAAFGSTADQSDEGLKDLAQNVSDMATAVPEDPHSRLSAVGEFATSWDDLDLQDKQPAPDLKMLLDLARETEETAMSVSGISNTEGAQAGWSQQLIGISSTTGFNGAYKHTGTWLSVSVIAGAGEAMERDYASTHATYRADMETPREVGLRAAERTLARLNPKAGKTGTFPVLFDQRVSSSLLRSLARCCYGPRIAKGTSFLGDKVGHKICNDNITIVDDPYKKRGHRSNPFDAEGIAPKRADFVTDGVLNMYFLDMRSAARLGSTTTGHATRGLSSAPSPSPSNLWIETGDASVEDLIRDMKQGFIATELMGASISLSTGDYSRGASGFWVENGKIAYPVSEMTIAGNLKDMFLTMVPGNDLKFTDGIDAPSLLVPSMTTASR
ncbi:MAG TPA: TldD/PmbA family protein [Alphaproteobacteria bacterium]